MKKVFLLSIIVGSILFAANTQAQCPYFTKVVAGINGYSTLGIKSDSTLWAWGRNYSGQLGIGNTTDQNRPVQVGTDKWIAIAAGTYHSLGIKSDGTLWAWGYNGYGQLGIGNTTNQSSPVQVGTSSNNKSIAAGAHSLLIDRKSVV